VYRRRHQKIGRRHRRRRNLEMIDTMRPHADRLPSTNLIRRLSIERTLLVSMDTMQIVKAKRPSCCHLRSID
jgi:hypothetical protein